MRTALGLILALAGGAAPAAAQTVGVISPPAYGLAPWWMREPIIASLGYVHTRLPANRASVSVEFQAIERSAPDATKAATVKIRALEETLRRFDQDKVRVETTFSTRALYEQYKDNNGRLLTNERPDKIERYQTSVRVTLTIYDVALLERVYATVMAAGPASAQPVDFSLQPENATNTELSRLAVADAATRARLAAEVSGARVGAVKLIDPTGRACQTDVLVAGASQSEGVGGELQTEVPPPMVVMQPHQAVPAPPPPPPPPPGAAGEAVQVTLQPPLEELTQTACVVYALAG
jgi:uncharacterized protein YggE